MASIHIVAAVALNGVIGNSSSNSMPWHLPSDLKRFKEITEGNTVLMGRKTFESIGKPLPNRKNLVITSDPGFKFKHHVLTYSSVAEAISSTKEDIYVIGGARVFEEAIYLAPKTFHITVVLAKPEGDVIFPFDGYWFMGKFFIPPNLALYHNTYRSEWLEENGSKFQFTTFESHS